MQFLIGYFFLPVRVLLIEELNDQTFVPSIEKLYEQVCARSDKGAIQIECQGRWLSVQTFLHCDDRWSMLFIV